MKSHAYALLVTCALGACASIPDTDMRQSQATMLAQTHSLTRQDIAVAGYTLASWRRISDPAAPVNVYIEGDGLAWISRSSPSMNPTPTRPVALELAAADHSTNVAYLARPCQFTPLEQSPSCNPRSWTAGQFDAEVIEAMNAALSQIPAAGGMNLIGFSGGGNIAALLAAKRSDIKSLRSVAGNIAPEAFTTHHKVSAMPTALSATSIAAQIKHMPQMHFIGAQDEIVPPAIFNTYARAAGSDSCTGSQIVGGANHTEGWVTQWPTLLARPLPCTP